MTTVCCMVTVTGLYHLSLKNILRLISLLKIYKVRQTSKYKINFIIIE